MLSDTINPCDLHWRLQAAAKMSKVDREVDQNEEETETESDDEIEIGPDGQARSKHSRSEKKSRKALLKLGMKPVPDITRVTMKKNHVRAVHVACCTMGIATI